MVDCGSSTSCVCKVSIVAEWRPYVIIITDYVSTRKVEIVVCTHARIHTVYYT